MVTRLETGIDLLDRKLNGGLPAGSLTAFSAAPASQADLFLLELATVRPTLYLTTIRPAEDIERIVDEYSLDNGEITIESIDPTDPVEETLAAAERLPDGGTLVLDPMTVFEQLEPQAYRDFLIELRDHIGSVDGTGLLHCLDGRDVPPRRDITEYVSDVVFNMSTERRGETLETDLVIPKYRGGAAVDDVIKLSLTMNVDVDISRNIV